MRGIGYSFLKPFHETSARIHKRAEASSPQFRKEAKPEYRCLPCLLGLKLEMTMEYFMARLPVSPGGLGSVKVHGDVKNWKESDEVDLVLEKE